MPFNEKGEFIRIAYRQRDPAPAPPRQPILTLLGITAAIAVIWLVVVFHRWIVLGLVFWAMSSIRQRFHW